MSKSPKNIAIMASGTGSNAQKIIEYFSDKTEATVRLIITNRKDAGVLSVAHRAKIPALVVSKESLEHSTTLLQDLDKYQIDFVVLAGFLLLIPPYLVHKYPHKMVNIHPALLPKYGGKGMYGMFVHEAVYRAKDLWSGITIHYVNEKYDEGSVVFQEKCEILPTDRPLDIAMKVLALEHAHYPAVIHRLVSSLP